MSGLNPPPSIELAGEIKNLPPPVVQPAPLAPATTAEEDRKTLGQRRVNLIWEITQAMVAIMVTGATIYSALKGVESLLLGNAFTLIIALYFVRQNHTKVGGIGGTDFR